MTEQQQYHHPSTNTSYRSTATSNNISPSHTNTISHLDKMNSNQATPSIRTSATIINPVLTKTLHITYNPSMIDRGDIYLSFRDLGGFDLIAFYDKYCFVRFLSAEQASSALVSNVPRHGILSFDAAKHTYEVPYPQPGDGNVTSIALHITHLPTNYTREEMGKIFSIFQGFIEAHFYGKYGYIYFTSPQCAMSARQVLRQETNLVVSYAKNPPKLSTSQENEDTVSFPFNSSSPVNGSFHRYAGNPLRLNGIVPSAPIINPQSTSPPKSSVFNHSVLNASPTQSSMSSYGYRPMERGMNHNGRRRHTAPRIMVDTNAAVQASHFYSEGRSPSTSGGLPSASSLREFNPLSADSSSSPLLPFPLDDVATSSSYSHHQHNNNKTRVLSPLSLGSQPAHQTTERRLSFLASPPGYGQHPRNSMNYSRSLSHGGLVTAFSYDQLYNQMGSLSLNTNDGNRRPSVSLASPTATSALSNTTTAVGNNSNRAGVSSILSQSLPTSPPLSTQPSHSTNPATSPLPHVTTALSSSTSLTETGPSTANSTIDQDATKQHKHSWNPLFYGSNLNFGIWGDEYSSSL